MFRGFRTVFVLAKLYMENDLHYEPRCEAHHAAEAGQEAQTRIVSVG